MGKLLVSDFEGGSMMEVILYTTDCPKCKVLEKMLENKNIKFSKNNNISDIQELGVYSAPQLLVNKELMDYNSATKWVMNYNA